MNKNLTINEVLETFVEYYEPDTMLTLVVKSKFESNEDEIKNKLLLFKECVNTLEIEIDNEDDAERVEELEGILAFFLRLTFAITQ
jgi:hypothetical protein